MIVLPKRPMPMARHIANVEPAPKPTRTEADLARLMMEDAKVCAARAKSAGIVSAVTPERKSEQVDIRLAKIIDCLSDWMTPEQVRTKVGIPRSTAGGDLGRLHSEGRVDRKQGRNPETKRPIFMYRRKPA